MECGDETTLKLISSPREAGSSIICFNVASARARSSSGGVRLRTDISGRQVSDMRSRSSGRLGELDRFEKAVVSTGYYLSFRSVVYPVGVFFFTRRRPLILVVTGVRSKNTVAKLYPTQQRKNFVE